MFSDVRGLLAAAMARFEETLPGPASGLEVSQLRQRALDALRIALPDPYVSFLGEVNGFEWNGCIAYGADHENVRPGVDFVEQNLAWRGDDEWNRRFVYFGESGTSWFVLDLVDSKFKVLDIPSGDEVRTVGDFDELVAAIGAEALGLS